MFLFSVTELQNVCDGIKVEYPKLFQYTPSFFATQCQILEMFEALKNYFVNEPTCPAMT